MRPENKSKTVLAITRSKGKMYEYSVPEEHHIDIKVKPEKLFRLAIGLLGDLAAESNRHSMEIQQVDDLRKELLFSAHFFDAYLQSKLDTKLDPYLILLGSASYYLCDLSGSSMVLANQLDSDCPDIGGDGVEDLLHWLLQGDRSTYFDGSEGPFGEYIDSISTRLLQFFEKGTGVEELFKTAKNLRTSVYEFGTPRQLLLGDIIVAILEKKYLNSTWYTIPKYSEISEDKWLPILQKESFIKELWPAQHLLGKAGVLLGRSAVVQMPTSAGKTKATELIVRSAFLAGRSSLTVIIAPFRALCHEIRNSLTSTFQGEKVKIDEFSDVFQTDFDIDQLFKSDQVIVVTPEKFLYVLRHSPVLSEKIGLVIFDEGHQFDSGTRGITYELLLTSLRLLLPKDTQKVLISAVLSNASALGEWLNGENSEIVSGINLTPTLRSVGFASWLDQLGRIEYVTNDDVETGTFFVPRVIESFELQLKGKETKKRFFPDKSKKSGKDIALYLGLKLVSQGAIAIFCGRKDTASGLCDSIVDKFSRNLSLLKPKEFSESIEVDKLCYLHQMNLGADAAATKSARLGIFAHHGNTPHGIRLAVEHSMREGLIHFVICTSTLAQGVNLPIKYLIVTSIYQGQEQIKIRDFHNLIGRTGRAGMHTEGSVLFADPIVYDKRKVWKDKWRWERVKDLLDPSKSEHCVSSLFDLIPLVIKNDKNKSSDKKGHSLSWDILSFATEYFNGWDAINKVIKTIDKDHGSNGFTEKIVRQQFKYFGKTLASIESFLLSNWDTLEGEISENDVEKLATETLAYFLADDEKKPQIISLFKLLAENISDNTTDSKQRIVFGRCLYGLNEVHEIQTWVQDNKDHLLAADNDDDFIDLIWPLLKTFIHNNTFNKCDKPYALKTLAQAWMQGSAFCELFELLKKEGAKRIWGTTLREFNIDQVVEICENGFAYDGSLFVGALCEFIKIGENKKMDELVSRLEFFQKRLKYGLPNQADIALYELGFSDRVIAQDLASSLSITVGQRWDLIRALKKNSDVVYTVMDKYPAYFHECFEEILI